MKFETLMLILFVFVLFKVWAIKIKKTVRKLVASDGFHSETKEIIKIILLTELDRS